MKNLLFLIFPILSCLIFWTCTNDSNSSNQEDSGIVDDGPIVYDDDLPVHINEEAAMVSTTIKSAPPPPPPPKSRTRDSIAQKLTIKSHFLKLGCCEKEKQANCCCEAVLEEYKKLKANNSNKLADLTTTDPILGPCKRKLVEAFDLIDHPPPPKKEEDNYDDLF